MSKFDEMSDGDLATLAIGGKQAAYRVLLDRHRNAVFRIARHHCGEDDGALDVTQQTFISAFAALDRYDRSRPFAHWITRIAVNKSHDWARRRRVRAFFGMAKPLDEAFEVSDPSVPADQQAADAQELKRTMAAIARLPARLKEVLVLRTIEGLNEAETADALGINQKAVETRLYRARKKIGEMMRGSSL